VENNNGDKQEMTDYYPSEEGAIFDAESYIIPCYPDGAIAETSSVKLGTTVAGRISVAVSTALGDGVGIALKASTGAGAPTRIPILFYGIIKVACSGTGHEATTGLFAINSITTTYATSETNTVANLVFGGGASYIMGMWLQTAAAVADEALLLVGKTS
jgi:hypothetical protein